MSLLKSFDIKSLLMKLFNVLFIFTFSYILYNVVFNRSVLWGFYKPAKLIIGASLFIAVFLMINYWLLKASKKTLKRLTIVNFLILIAIQSFFFVYFRVTPTWDFGAIMDIATWTVESGRGLDQYLYFQYPNNIPLYLIYVAVISILNFVGVTDYLPALILLNMSVVLLSVFCTYYLIYCRYGSQRATLFSYFMLCITPFYTYTTIVYTDTLTMIFPILSVIIYMIFCSSTGSKRYGWALLLSLILGIGILTKANVVIAMVAILIHYFMTQKLGKSLVFFILLILPFLVGNTVYKEVVATYSPIEKEEMGYPITHWVMMGMLDEENRPGGYNKGDVMYTDQLKRSGLTNKEITAEHINVIQERLETYGVKGYLGFLSKKINFTWGDGTYYATNKLARGPIGESIFQPYIIGDKNALFVMVCQIIHVANLILIVIAGISLIKETNRFEQLLTIMLFGVFLFLVIWETRSRYLVLYIPIITMVSIYGLGVLSNRINNVLKRD